MPKSYEERLRDAARSYSVAPGSFEDRVMRDQDVKESMDRLRYAERDVDEARQGLEATKESDIPLMSFEDMEAIINKDYERQLAEDAANEALKRRSKR
jgi:hypothetical protein